MARCIRRHSACSRKGIIKGIIKCVSAHALASCGIGNNVEGFINHENTRVSDAFTYNADHRLALIDIFSDLAFILMGTFLRG